MTLLRIFGGILSFALAALLGNKTFIIARFTLGPTLRSIREQTSSLCVLRIFSFSISGWGILVFIAALTLLTIGFIILGAFILSIRPASNHSPHPPTN